MVEGFSLELQNYCSYCGDFVPDVEKTDITALGDAAYSYITMIRCQNAYKCARMVANLRRKV